MSDPINTYDSSDSKCIHYKNSDGYEWWHEYDTNGRLIHFKNSDGFEYWQEFNSKGNLIHFKNSKGYEDWQEFNSNGKLIHYKDSDGYERWYEYDSNGNLIHFKDRNGYERWYDSDGKLVDKPTEKKVNTTMSHTEPIEISPNQMTKNEFMANYGNCNVSLALVEGTTITMKGYIGVYQEFLVIVQFSSLYHMDAIKNGIESLTNYKVHQFDPDYMGVKSMETGRIVNEWSMDG